MLKGINTAYQYNCFPGGARGEGSTCQYRRHRDTGLIPGLGRSPGEGDGNPLQYSCLENSMDSGAWWATYSPCGCKELDTSEHAHMNTRKVYLST